MRWRWASWMAAQSPSPAAATLRCECGTWPPANPSETHSSAGAAPCERSRPKSGKRVLPTGSSTQVGIGATNTATIERMHGEISGEIRWDTIAALEVKSSLHALTLTSGQILIIAAELGIVAFELPGEAAQTSRPSA